MEKKTKNDQVKAEQQLSELISKLDPEKQNLVISLRRALRKRYSTSKELAYDYGKSLVIAYSPNERGSDAPVAISADKHGLRLAFNNGVHLPDPKNLLIGNATIMRYIIITSAKDLNKPEVSELMDEADRLLQIPIDKTGTLELIIKQSKPKAAKSKIDKPADKKSVIPKKK